jgi:hypothetical protein
MRAEPESIRTPKLPLSPQERTALRRAHLRAVDFAARGLEQLDEALDGAIGTHRLRELRALALFQQLPSIGPAMAADLVLLGYHAPEELVGEDPERMLRKLERLAGKQDPCVGDCLHCAVYYAEHPDAPHDKPWWHWSALRLAAARPGRSRRG